MEVIVRSCVEFDKIKIRRAFYFISIVSALTLIKKVLDFEIVRRDVLDQITEEEREAPTFQKLEGRLRALTVDGWLAKLGYEDLRSRIY